MKTMQLMRFFCWLLTTAICFKVILPFSLYMVLNQQQHVEVTVKLKPLDFVGTTQTMARTKDFDKPATAATSEAVVVDGTAAKKQKSEKEKEETLATSMADMLVKEENVLIANKKEMLTATATTTKTKTKTTTASGGGAGDATTTLQLPMLIRPSSSNSSSLPVTKKRQELDGLSMAANRFKIAYPTIARAELLAFQVPLQPQETGGRVRIVSEYSKAAFEREILNGVPVLFKNFYNKTKLPHIDARHVRDTVGFMEIYVKTGNYGDPNYGSGDAHFHAHTQYATTMGEYIDTVIVGGQTDDGVIPYAGNIVCDKVCEELMMGVGNAITFPFYEKMRPTAKFWVSKTGTLTPLHRDTADNLIVQLSGRKEWTLFPIRKDVADRLYYNPSPINGVGSERSLVNISNPDLDQFPAFDGVRQEYSYTATVDAGDLLFLPVGWGHEVYTVTDSVMLNYWVSKPKSIYEHVCYTLGNDDNDDNGNDILDMVYSLDNVASIKDASSILPVSGLKLRGGRSTEDYDDDYENGVTLKFHQPVTEQFTMIFDAQLPHGTTGQLATKRDAVNKKVYWSLQLVDCFTLKLDYITTTAAAPAAATSGGLKKSNKTTTMRTSGSVEWQTQGTMCNDDKHRIIASVDHNHVTFTMDQETSGTLALLGTIHDCEASVSSCTLQAGALTLPIGTVGYMPLAFVHRKKAL